MYTQNTVADIKKKVVTKSNGRVRQIQRFYIASNSSRVFVLLYVYIILLYTYYVYGNCIQSDAMPIIERRYSKGMETKKKEKKYYA